MPISAQEKGNKHATAIPQTNTYRGMKEIARIPRQ